MSIPALDDQGFLPPGIYLAPLDQVVARFGSGNPTREGLGGLLTEIVGAARRYPTLKRVLVWGSFVSAKPEPRDLDFSVVIGRDHRGSSIASEHRRFFTEYDANVFYGVDNGYLTVPDYNFDKYIEFVNFFGTTRTGAPRGIVEVQIWGEYLIADTRETENG